MNKGRIEIVSRSRFIVLALLTLLLAVNQSLAGTSPTIIKQADAATSWGNLPASQTGPDAPTASDDVVVALSNGLALGPAARWSEYMCVGDEVCKVGDANGDGRDDAIVFVRDNSQTNPNDVYVALSNNTRFGTPQKWSDYFCVLDETCAVGDINGDGRDDIIAFVGTNNAVNDSDV